MGKIVIKRRVDLDFLGEEYKDAYLTFRTIPVKDYAEFIKSLNGLEQSDKPEENAKAVTIMLECLKKYFFEGKFPEGDKLQAVENNDLDDLDPETAIKCFEKLVGRETDPKLQEPLENPSSTEPALP